ncbi:MAG: lysine-2,3-aminomutase-like protein [Rhodospirillaceae bacterium]|nr:lysine-2,3-aminomutase-like protein [Rhodospirillaceae bacterium]
MNASAHATLRTPAQLAAADLIAERDRSPLEAVAARYAVAVTPAVAALIRETGLDGPVARQYLPSRDELTIRPDELADPIGDEAHSPVPGVVHRYPDRVLLMPTRVCAVYCRFCFRREAVGPDSGGLSETELHAALDYIRATPSIWEVILTGGDPLVLSARRLGAILSALDEIPHVATIRIHSRVPVAAPERIDDVLLSVLAAVHKPVNLAVHCNHAAELTGQAVAAVRKLRRSGVMLFGQSVLLKGVNDDAHVLESLFRAMLAAGIKPYYLHQLDRAPGTSHFAVPLDRGREIVKRLRGKLSGLAQPIYVLDIPGGAGKVPIGPAYLTATDTGYIVEDPAGSAHAYESSGS